MKYVYLILSWFFGILFLLVGFRSLLSSPLASLSLFIASCFLLPPARNFAFSKTGMNLNSKVRSISVIVLLIAFSVFQNASDQQRVEALEQQKKAEMIKKSEEKKQEHITYFSKNRENILADLDIKFEKGSYEEVINVTKQYLDSKDQQLLYLHKEATSRLKEVKNAQREQVLLAMVEAIPASNVVQNTEIYKELREIRSDNEDYNNKYALYSEKLRIQKQIQRAESAEKQKQQQIADTHKKKIEAQFSAWNGSHRNLEHYIKNIMNDPSSYDHDETRYADKGTYLIVQTTFRGKNAFGGVILNTIQAKVDLDGNILQIIN